MWVTARSCPTVFSQPLLLGVGPVYKRGMSHVVNEQDSVVTDSIDGLIAASAGRLTRLDGYPDVKVIVRADWTRDRVALLSGGGAGHEPAHAGFVGAGLLTAAVSGEVFASPTVDAVLAGIRAVTGDAGCLVIVKNYTGDRLNFGLAVERARAGGLAVEMVIVSDDVALEDSTQPRGLAGTLFVHKVAGAAAESGASLADVVAAARHAADSIRTIGVAVSGVAVPFHEPPRDFTEGTAELGLGIHGEPGREIIDVGSAASLLGRVSDELSKSGDGPVALLVNNLGGLSVLEMGIVAREVLDTPLGARADLLVGPASLMTSLDMRGLSITSLALDDSLRAAVLAPVDPGTAWVAARELPTDRDVSLIPYSAPDDGAHVAASDDPRARAALTAVCAALIDATARLDAADARVGDGDTGSTFATAARRIQAELDALPLADSSALLLRLSTVLSTSMGGSSGVLISIFLSAAGSSLRDGAAWADALDRGVDAMQTYGGAHAGDRTMLDALIPAVAALSPGTPFDAAIAAADGAKATAEMAKAGAGRSAYVGSEHLLGAVDPGADAMAVIFAAVASSLGE